MYNNPNNNNNPYNYPPNPNVPYQNMNQNNDAYYQSNPNMYAAPPYQQNPQPYMQNPPYQTGYPAQDPIYVQVPIVQQQQIIVESGIGSREPQAFYCPYCLTNVVTEVHYEPGDKTSLMACCLCFFGGVICCLLPYCINDCQDAIHLCPLCRCTLGRVPF